MIKATQKLLKADSFILNGIAIIYKLILTYRHIVYYASLNKISNAF